MEIRARAIAAVGALCLGTVGSAGTNSWTAVGPAGGLVRKVAYNPANPSIVYMISAGGFLRSQDGGATWQTIRNDFLNIPADLAVDPSDPSRVYVVVYNAPFLLLSTDNGATLPAVASFPSTLINPERVQVSQDGATVCVTAGLNVTCSTDRAQTWSLRTPIAPDPTATGRVNKLLIDPTDSRTLYASAGIAATGTYGFFVTHDGAATWQQLVSTTDTNSVAWDLAYSPGNPAIIWAARYSGLWYTNNGGRFWASVGFNGGATAVAVSPLNPNIVYVGGGYGQLFSWDNASSVSTNISGNNLTGTMASIAPHPTQSATLLTGGLGGLWGSTDGGGSWSPRMDGLLAADVVGLSADPQSDRIYIGVAEGGLYCLANGAGLASPLNNVALAHPTVVPNYLQVNTLLAQGGAPGPLYASIDALLEKSLDGGNSWTLLPASGETFALASSAAAPQTILAGSNIGVSRSTDGGASWAGTNTGFPAGVSVPLLAMSATDPMTVYAAPQSPVTAAVLTNYGVYGSTDGGQTWSPRNSGMTSSSVSQIVVSPTSAAVVYASTSVGLQKSTDAGASWATLLPFGAGPNPTSGLLAIDPAHPQILYAGTYGKISRSVDAGATWETVLSTQAWSKWLVSAMLVDPNRTSNLLVGTSQAGVQEITIEPDMALQVAAPSGPIGVGVTSSYHYTVTNKGPFSATGVQVALQLPAGAQSIAAAPSLGTCVVANTAVNCSLGTFSNGASATVSLSAVGTTAGAFQVTGTVQADQPDSDTTNNAVTSNSTVAVLADVSVTDTGTTSAQAGAAVSYTLTVANAGPNTATSTQLTYQLGTGLTPGMASADTGSCTTAGTQVTCNLGDLAPAKSATITINATAAAAGTATSSVTVTTTATDPVMANNTASAITTITSAPSSSGGGSSSGGSGGSGSSGGSHGGGGALSIQWLLILMGVLGIRLGLNWPVGASSAGRLQAS